MKLIVFKNRVENNRTTRRPLSPRDLILRRYFKRVLLKGRDLVRPTEKSIGLKNLCRLLREHFPIPGIRTASVSHPYISGVTCSPSYINGCVKSLGKLEQDGKLGLHDGPSNLKSSRVIQKTAVNCFSIFLYFSSFPILRNTRKIKLYLLSSWRNIKLNTTPQLLSQVMLIISRCSWKYY